MSSRQHVRCYRLLLAPAVLTGGMALAGDQWYLEPAGSLQLLYDDNIGLSVDKPVSTPALVGTLQAKGGRRNRVLDLGLEGKVIRRQFFQDEKRNTTDLALKASLVRTGRLDQLGLDMTIERYSTLTSELTTSGLVNAGKRRVRRQIEGSWRHQFAPRWSAGLSVGWQDVHYQDADLTPLTDYRYTTSGLDLAFAYDPRTRLLGQLTLSRYRNDSGSVTTDTTGVLAGVERDVSPTWSLRALAGARRSKSRLRSILGSRRTTDTGYLVDLNSTWRFPAAELVVGLNRSLSPSGGGDLLDTQRVTVEWSQRLDERWRWELKGEGYRNEGGSATANRTFVRITPSLHYRLDREWTASAAYRYRRQKYDSSAEAASSNALLFTFAYRGLSKK